MIINKRTLQYLFIVLVTLISIRFWSFQGIPDGIYDAFDLLMIGALVLIVLYYTLIEPKKYYSIFKANVCWFLILPLVSGIGAYIYHDQSFVDSLLILRFNLYWLLYFVLHIFDVSPRKIVNLMVVIGCVWAGLTIFQQFTYPHYLFYTRSDGDSEILRAGVYRFMLYRHHYGMFLVLFFLYKFLVTKRSKYFLFVFFGLIGFYFFGTRQFLAATIICMGIVFLIHNPGRKAIALFSISLFFGVLYSFSDVLLGKFIEITNEDFNENNIRLLAADFYFYEYWPDDWFAKVIGNGVHYYSNTEYGKEVTYYEEELGLYRSDVGIIGTYNAFGILYLLNLIWYNMKGLKNKYYTKGTVFLKTIFISSLILLPLTVYYNQPSAIPFFCFVSYIVEKGYISKIKADLSLKRSFHKKALTEKYA